MIRGAEEIELGALRLSADRILASVRRDLELASALLAELDAEARAAVEIAVDQVDHARDQL